MLTAALPRADHAPAARLTPAAPQKSVFAEYRIESKNANRIGLEVMLPNLLHALKSGHAATATQIKLTRHGASPFLSIISQVGAPQMCVRRGRVTGGGCTSRHPARARAPCRRLAAVCGGVQSVEGGVSVQQDVPVRVLVAAELERYNEPMMPPPPVRRRRCTGNRRRWRVLLPPPPRCRCLPSRHYHQRHPRPRRSGRCRSVSVSPTPASCTLSSTACGHCRRRFVSMP